MHRASFVLATGGMFMVPRGEFTCMKFVKRQCYNFAFDQVTNIISRISASEK